MSDVSHAESKKINEYIDEDEIVFHVKHPIIRMGILFLLFVIVFLISFCVGHFSISPIHILKILFGQRQFDIREITVMTQVRFPRIIGATCVGGCLAVAGAVYQGLFNNPMVSADILGSTAGAAFGAALGIILGLGTTQVSIIAFVCGLLAVAVAVFVASRYRKDKTLGLVLSGIMVAALFRAGLSFVKLVADPTNELPAISYWLMGSLAGIKNQDLPLLVPMAIVGMIPLMLIRWRLNVMTLDETEARSIGMNTNRIRVLAIICSTLMTSACVAVSGMIGWVGLMIPHLCRKFVGADFKILLPSSLLMGATFLILVDDLARTLTTVEIPIGILTAFVGTPFFLHLILQGGKR